VLANPPWRESDLAGGAALRTLLRRRRLLLKAGVLAIVNLVLVGVWLAGGGAYFWPVWPMLGSVIVLALNALPVTAALRERYLGPTG
jgi:hypothetical protein